VGRFVQGAGGVFALVGAAYIATTNFPASRAATLIGATQMFGMAGGSAGQFVVGPIIARGVPWQAFWAAMGVIGLLMSVALYALLPGRTTVETPKPVVRRRNAKSRRPKAGCRGPAPVMVSSTRLRRCSAIRSPSCAG
jgi:MFS family permease